MNAEPIVLDVSPGGARVEWSRDGLGSLAAPGSAPQPAPVWRLDGEPDWTAIESLWLISAAFEDGRMLALVATRPARAGGHDEVDVHAALVREDGEVVELTDALLSTEYDANGTTSRIGLELYTHPEAVPLRVAADRTAEEQAGNDAGRAIPMSFRLEGSQGAGLLETVSRG